MRRRFNLDKSGRFVDRDGRVLPFPPMAFTGSEGQIIGRIDSLSVDFPAGDKGGLFVVVEQPPPTTTTKTPPTPAESVTVVFDHWVKATDRAAITVLTPSRRRTIERALKEATAVECCHAVDGLMAWRQKKPGDTQLSAVFGTRPQGRPLREQIEFFMGQVHGVGSATVTSEEMVKINRAKSLILDAFDMPGSEKLQQDAARARVWLEGEGWTIEAEGLNGRPTFRAPQ